ncbi:ParB/RepB/Spo0J family partition protein [Frateuria edaphi]|uniref:ParB/RepB/Spo0J family partition protein n=1 Tax=Frateuria edaphi TaxID=2898793 RepID=UPI001E49EB56|nr:ParB N-terminal domain-containing protein [Frateuria edaphi]UGB46955.1 ParB/RepB/Spo0J family partition protein [Frateuria edaphi]
MEAGAISLIPLSQLYPTTLNVRKIGGASIDELAASITAHGLIHNLVVAPGSVNGGYLVIAGERRLKALAKLQAEGALPASLVSGIPCRLVDVEEAHEASLAENIIREAMHPADEFAAFRNLVNVDELTVPEIASRFGKTEKYVEQRLRLGNVAPELLEEYKAGKANLEQMMALAIVEDHKAQREAWSQGERISYYRQPEQLRGLLVTRDVSLTSSIGAFVGVEAYEAAGGTPRRDLFSDFVTLPDSKLVRKLAKAKLEDEAAKLRKKGWGWVEAMPTFDYSERAKYRQSSSKTPSEKLGAVVTIGNGGKVEVVAGLLKPGQRAPASAAEKKPKADTRATEDFLVGVRTGLLRVHLRDNPELALTVLAASLGCSFFDIDDEACAGVLDAGVGGYARHTQEAGEKAANPHGQGMTAAWEKRLRDGAKKDGSVLAWLMKQDQNVAYDLMAFVAAGGIDTNTWRDEDEAAIHAFAVAVGADLGAGTEHITPEWLAKQPKSYILEAVTEAAGKDAAVALEKGKAKDLAAKAHELLAEKQWIPSQLRAPEPAKPKPVAKKASKKRRAAAEADPA